MVYKGKTVCVRCLRLTHSCKKVTIRGVPKPVCSRCRAYIQYEIRRIAQDEEENLFKRSFYWMRDKVNCIRRGAPTTEVIDGVTLYKLWDDEPPEDI